MRKIADDGFARHVVKDGVTHSFLPGADVPEWAAKLIHERHFATGEAEDEPPGPSQGPPPRAGKGSGLKPWADYAAAQGVDLGQDAGRDEIVAACEAAGVAVD